MISVILFKLSQGKQEVVYGDEIVYYLTLALVILAFYNERTWIVGDLQKHNRIKGWESDLFLSL